MNELHKRPYDTDGHVLNAGFKTRRGRGGRSGGRGGCHNDRGRDNGVHGRHDGRSRGQQDQTEILPATAAATTTAATTSTTTAFSAVSTTAAAATAGAMPSSATAAAAVFSAAFTFCSNNSHFKQQFSGRWGPQVCECGQPGHVDVRCTALLPAFHSTPSPGPHAKYPFSGEYTSTFRGRSSPSSYQTIPASPDPHGTSAPPDARSTSAEDWAVPGYFVHPDESSLYRLSRGNILSPCSYLHGAFIAQKGTPDNDVWVANSGASSHMMTHNWANVYDIRPPTPGRERIIIGD